MINISEQLTSKRMVDIDDLLEFLLNKRELIIGDDYYRERFNEDLTEAFKEYASMTVPDVEIGQTVWVIREKYNLDTQKIEHKIIECKVHKKTIKKKYTFSVRGTGYYTGTFTKNSIGKTVFFSEEDAKNYLNIKKKKQ